MLNPKWPSFLSGSGMRPIRRLVKLPGTHNVVPVMEDNLGLTEHLGVTGLSWRFRLPCWR